VADDVIMTSHLYG